MIWSDLAQHDLDEIFRYFESLSLRVAITYMEEIIMAGDLLEFFPEMGPKEPALSHLNRNYRSVLVLRRYKLIYRNLVLFPSHHHRPVIRGFRLSDDGGFQHLDLPIFENGNVVETVLRHIGRVGGLGNGKDGEVFLHLL